MELLVGHFGPPKPLHMGFRQPACGGLPADAILTRGFGTVDRPRILKYSITIPAEDVSSATYAAPKFRR